ncbi:MAG: GNAT family N-acetyltransferase [Chloroflexota bacterium]
MVEVRELETNEYPAWNDLVADSPQGNVFLRADWLHMLGETDPDLGLLILGCFDKNRLVGGQAVTCQRRWGMTLSASFEFFYNGPLLSPDMPDQRASRVAKQRQILSALAEGMSARLAYIDVDTHPSFQDARPFLRSGWQVEPIYTHIWRMDDIERAWLDMNREKRREIKRAGEQFVFGVEESDPAMDAFLPLYHGTMGKFSWRPSARWEAIFRRRFHWMQERDGCRLYTARTEGGQLVGGVVVLLSRQDNTAYLWRQGSARGFVEAGGIPALYWHAATDLAGEFPNVNFGGSPQLSLDRFKDYLGAEAVMHFRLVKCNSRYRLAVFERALKSKDIVYNLVMGVAYGPWQRLRHRGMAAAQERAAP